MRKWQGQLAIDQESYEWFAALLDTMGEDKGLRFARQLAERGLTVRRGHTLLSQLVAAGEFKMVIDQYDHIAYRGVKSGSPTNYIFFNPVLAEAPNATWITRQSPAPSRGGAFRRFPVRQGVPAAVEPARPAGGAQRSRLSPERTGQPALDRRQPGKMGTEKQRTDQNVS